MQSLAIVLTVLCEINISYRKIQFNFCINFYWFARNGTLWNKHFLQKTFFFTLKSMISFIAIPWVSFDWFRRTFTLCNEYFNRKEYFCFKFRFKEFFQSNLLINSDWFIQKMENMELIFYTENIFRSLHGIRLIFGNFQR